MNLKGGEPLTGRDLKITDLFANLATKSWGTWNEGAIMQIVTIQLSKREWLVTRLFFLEIGSSKKMDLTV